nr:hypothetical protein GCM10020093_063950 [Planobispora longispora]
MPDLGELLTTPIPLPFGWGSLPFWFLLFVVASGVVGVLGAMSKGSTDGEEGSRKHDHAEMAARGSLLGGRGQIAGVVVGVVALLITLWTGQTQRQWEVQRQELEMQREEQRQRDDQMRAHADFVRRVAVLAYSDPAGMKIKIRNANPAATKVWILSLVGAKKARQNFEMTVSPCSQATFLMHDPKTWTPAVLKGDLYWAPGLIRPP